MFLKIFDVEHGQCAHLMSDTGTHVLIDCGHNTTTGWRPSTYLQRLGVHQLDRLLITNYDEDHASDLENLRHSVDVRNLGCNPTVSPDDLEYLKYIGGIGSGIKALADMKRAYGVPGQEPSDPALAFQYFWNAYPSDFEDENNLSMVAVIDFGGVRFCFPGDMEKAGWERLLRNPDFVKAMGLVHVLVASHHGRQNGCSELLYSTTGLRPQLTIISDSGIQHASQETVRWYGDKTGGLIVEGYERKVLTTRSDGRIMFVNGGYGWTVQTMAG